MAERHHVLSRLWQAFPLAPRSYLLCEDPSVIGAPFFVMERRPGVVVRREVPAIFGGGDDPAPTALSPRWSSTPWPTSMRSIPPPPTWRISDAPTASLQRQVAGWTRRWHGSKVEDSPLVDELIGWLEANLPDSPPPSLVHNDWRLDNMAVAEDDPGRCVAVFDWDMCTPGRPSRRPRYALLSVWYDEAEVPSHAQPDADRRPRISRSAMRPSIDTPPEPETTAPVSITTSSSARSRWPW